MMDTGSSEELEQRLARVSAEDTLRGFFFTGTLDEVRHLGDPALWRRCVEAAGAERFMFFFSYPVSAFTRLLYRAAWALSGPERDFTGAMRWLGQRIAPDYLECGTGRVLVLLSGRDPRRLLNGFPSAYRTAVRHGDCSISWLAPSEARVIIDGSPVPAAYYEGAVQGVFDFTGLVQVTTAARQVGPLRTEVDVAW